MYKKITHELHVSIAILFKHNWDTDNDQFSW